MAQSSLGHADSIIAEDAMRNLLASLAGNTVDPYPSPHVPPPNTGISWNLLDVYEDTEIPLTAEQQAVAHIAGAILQRYDDLPSDDEQEERSDDEDHGVEEPIAPNVPAGPGTCNFIHEYYMP